MERSFRHQGIEDCFTVREIRGCLGRCEHREKLVLSPSDQWFPTWKDHTLNHGVSKYFGVPGLSK